MAEELAASSYKYQCRNADRSGRIIKLACERPIHINSYCYDRVNGQHILAVTVQYFDREDHYKEKGHIEYVFLNRDLRLVEVLRENVQGSSPRLLIAPDGTPWVRIMSRDSDYTKEVVLPLRSRGRICKEKKLPIHLYRQEMLVGDNFISFGYHKNHMGKYAGKPDGLVLWQFDKNGLFQKRTILPIKFSYLGTLLAEPDGISVFNLLPENDTAGAEITMIDRKGKAQGQWISQPFSGIRMLAPVSGYQYLQGHYVQSFWQNNSTDKREFIGLSVRNSFVHLIFSQEGELLEQIPILQLPEEIKVQEIDMVHRAASGWIGFSYMTENHNSGFIQWDGEKVVMEITAKSEGPEKNWTKVRGRTEMELAYQCMTHILQDEEDSFIMLSPFRPHYPAKENEIIILRQ